MIRVGFVMAGGQGWMGGVNYISNLMKSVMQLPDRQLELVLIVPPGVPADTLRGFPDVEKLVTPLAQGSGPMWVFRKGLARLLKRDVLLEGYLRKHRIDVLSHSGHLGARAQLRTLCWIPDFQHLRQPDFFQPQELQGRSRGFREMIQNCTTLVLSSKDAQSDLKGFVPEAVPKSRVLNFVSGVGGGAKPTHLEALQAKYALEVPYMHLPNQFWVHKNHSVVIEALAVLKRRGRRVPVISTGHTQDPRQPGYFDRLQARAKELGLVPYEDMLGLMTSAAAVINPSLFEGWSTTVEESRSMGKAIVLSDIPVHREQNPEFGFFFDPANAEQLADAMEAALDGWRPDEDASRRAQAQLALHQRFSDFGRRYQEIVLETCHG